MTNKNPQVIIPQNLIDEKEKDSENVELEIRFGGEFIKIQSRLYNTIISNIKQLYPKHRIIKEKSTVYNYNNDIRRVKIDNREFIGSTKYTKEEAKSEEYEETKTTIKDYLSPYYPYKIAASSEIRKETEKRIGANKTTTRNRTSIIPLTDKGKDIGIRYDFTIATISSSKSSGLVEHRIEIEILKPLDAETIIEYITQMLKFILESPIIYTITELNELRAKMNGIFVDKPEDLLFEHISSKGIFGTNNYLVTIKTDGIRKLLMIQGISLYLVGVHGTGLFTFAKIMENNALKPFSGYIIDVELVLDDITTFYDEDTIYPCYAFDVIRYVTNDGGTTLTSTSKNKEGIPFLVGTLDEPLFCRFKLLRDFTKLAKIKKVPLILKEFEFVDTPESFFRANNEILDGEYDFETDGLIFVNADKAYLTYAFDTKCHQNRWISYTKKWKPTRKLTNDYLYQDNNLFLSDGNVFSGTQNFKWNGRFSTQLEDGTEIQEGQIVEFMLGYIDEDGNQIDPEDEVEQKEDRNNVENEILIPIKIRYDKEKPSSRKAAEDVWHLLHDGIEEDTLRGKSFQNQRKAMNKFKSNTYSLITPGKEQFDAGPGQGGDIRRYMFGRLKVRAFEPNEKMRERFRQRAEIFGYTVEAVKEKEKKKKRKKEKAKKEEKEDDVEIFKHPNGSIIYLYPFGAEDERVKNIGRIISFSTSFNSITFFDDEMQDSFFDNLSSIMSVGASFFLVGLDAYRLNNIIGDTYDDDDRILNFRLDEDKVYIKIKNTFVDQEELAIDWDNIGRKLEEYGFHIDEEGFVNEERWLNRDELAYSDSTRYIKVTYIGFDSDPITLEDLPPLPKPPQGDEIIIMDGKGRIIIKEEGLIPNPTNTDSKLPNILRPDQEKDFTYNKITLTRVGVLGFNDCLIHAVCRALSEDYGRSSLEEKKERGRGVRNDLATKLEANPEEGVKTFTKLGNGGVSREYSFQQYLNLIKGNEPLGEEMVGYLEDIFSVEILMLWYLKTDKYEGFVAGIAHENTRKYKKTIIILNWNNYHYEAVGYRTKNKEGKEKLYFQFSPTHEIIMAIRAENNVARLNREITLKR